MTARAAPKAKRDWSLRSRAVRALLYQVVALGLIVAAVWFLAHNTMENMRVRGIQSGFDFLAQPAGFDIGEMPVAYDALDPYWKAFGIGVLNTLRVAIIGIVLTTIIGTLVGIGRFSPNALVRGLCYGYVELFRNVPILLQLLMWYLLLTEWLPDPGEPLSAFGLFFLSKGGFTFPVPVWGAAQAYGGIGIVLGIAVAWGWSRWVQVRFDRTGHRLPVVLPALVLIAAGAVLGWLAGGAPNAWNLPVAGELSVDGGSALTPEFLSVLFGLVFYTASFVAEVVRAGIQSVPRGQVEAANAIGLSRGQQMRLVVLPQALRVIIPPITNQYLNLTKNSSLAVAIGYPDIVSVATTSLNQNGQAIECLSIIAGVYLMLNLVIAVVMGAVNTRVQLKER